MIGYRVIVGNDEVLVVLQVGVCRQEIIHGVKKAVGGRLRIEALPTPAHEEGLLGSQGTVDTNIIPVGMAGSGCLLQVVGRDAKIRRPVLDVRRGKIIVQQVGGNGVNAVLSADALAAARDSLPWISRPREWVD